MPFEAFQPKGGDPALIAEVCSELMRPDPTVDPATRLPAPGSGPTPDLRGADVDAVSGAGQGGLLRAAQRPGPSPGSAR